MFFSHTREAMVYNIMRCIQKDRSKERGSMFTIRIGENEAGQRLDRFLRKYFAGAPLSAVYRIIRRDLKVNGRRAKEDTVLAEGDELSVYLTDAQMAEFVKPVRVREAKRTFRIIYEDENILIAGKPKGLLTHGDAKEKKNTLVNQVCGYLQSRGEYDPARELTFSPAPVNRLDRNTTGLVVFGKTAEALRVLTEVIRNREQVRKIYLALVSGRLEEEMRITDPLKKDPKTNRVTVTDAEDPSGQPAETLIRPVITGERFSLAEAELITGRTHQIRVHLASRGFPIAGDAAYGDPGVNGRLRKMNIRSQLLHACRLEFGSLPAPLEYLSGKVFEMQPPGPFQKAQKELTE